MIRTLRRYITGEKGVAYIEFALVLPILLLIFIGAVELTRFILANQKLDKAAHGLANYLSQQEEPMTTSMAVMNTAFDSLMSPFATDDAGFRMLELKPDLNNPDDKGHPLLVTDTKTSGSVGGTKIGAKGGPVTGAGVKDLRIERIEYLVGIESYYTYRNIVPGMDKALTALGFDVPNNDGQQLYKRSIMRYRMADFEFLVGQPTAPVEPKCCGTYCDGEGGLGWHPHCACLGGGMCDPSGKYEKVYGPNCKHVASKCGGGGGTPCKGDCGGGGG